MKLTVLNEISIEMIKYAKVYEDTANSFAKLFAETDNKEYQASFRTKSACAEAIRNSHAVACQLFHYLESNMDPKEIERLNKIEEDKGK